LNLLAIVTPQWLLRADCVEKLGIEADRDR
jgi:hypothetical protein